MLRKAVLAIALVAAVVVVPASTALAAPTGTAAGATLTISVSPASRLRTGDLVTVQGTGAGSFAQVRIYQCPRGFTANPIASGRCTVVSGVQAEDSGVYRRIDVPVASNDPVACGYNGCSLVAVEVDEWGRFVASAAAPIAFAPGITATTTSRTTGLDGGETVVVRVSGLRAGEAFNLGYCVDDQPSTCGAQPHTAGADGSLVVEMEQLPGWTYYVPPFGDPQIRGCRPPAGCHIIAWTGTGPDDITGSSSIPLGYVGEQLSATFAPIDGLTDNARVAIAGRAFGAEGQGLEVRQLACFSLVQGSGWVTQMPSWHRSAGVSSGGSAQS
jgi:hypothetical protein